MVKKNLVWFHEVGKHDVGIVGGKGANLGEMTTANLPIPYGFIITAQAYFSFLKFSKLEPKIRQALQNINYENNRELNQVSQNLQKMIIDAEIPNSLISEIMDYYSHLPVQEKKYLSKKISTRQLIAHRIKNLYQHPLVAVRSSATAEDLPDASFAGQQETYLNVRGEINLIKKVKECWASLFTPRAIYYRYQKKFDHFKVGLATVVQRMVQSDKSGIAFSIDPVNNDKFKIVIEAIYGLGEYIVQGKVTPDHYEVDKRSFTILKKEAHYQSSKFVKSGTNNVEVKLGKTEGSTQKLSEVEIVKIAMLVKEIEKHYYFPQDIEWAIEGDKVFIVQSRPITTISNVDKQSNKTPSPTSNLTPLFSGAPASPGIASGPVKIIRSPSEIDLIKKGDVLVAPQTNPDYVPAMKRAAAIITDKGGRTSHAAIVSRELGIPAVVGCEVATKRLKNEQIVSVNGTTGDIFLGNLLSANHQTSTAGHQSTKVRHHTLTRVYVNLAEVEQAHKVAQMDVDGIGLLRAEFMIAGIGTHPKEFIREKKEHYFINKLTSELEKFVRPFNPRPVVYRATDFKTNEYRHLVGGKKYEPVEENPMLGFRGASRYIINPDVFALELQAIKNIWEKGFHNLHLMIPFVRVPWELVRIKEIVRDFGLFDYHGFKLWIMVEVPACAINLPEFIKIGIDGVSIGTNDLTMMLMGVDRDSSEVANIYDERNPAVISTLEYIVKTCTQNSVTCSICGQAASDYPEIVETLVRRGITSVSINPDSVERTRELIYHIEKKHFKELLRKK